jgi:hypothetical protein
MTPTVGTSYRFGAVAYASGCPSHFEVWKGSCSGRITWEKKNPWVSESVDQEG